MQHRFQIGPSTSQSPSSTPIFSASTSNPSSDDEEDTLPYPTELPRSDFLTQDFDPQTYLSTLRNRHQTLEDLRSDLRARSQLLNKELLDLVNGNYEDFLSLGAGLRGGGEMVEGVRVGLLAFRREVEGVRKSVKQREEEVGGLVRERKQVRGMVVVGRKLVEIHEMVGELEGRLGIKTQSGGENPISIGEFDDDEFDEAEGDDQEASAVPGLRRLQTNTDQYLRLTRLISQVGHDHPFIRAQGSRVDELRRILLLDLASALSQAKSQASNAPDAVLKILNLYRELGMEREGVRVLQKRKEGG